MSKRLSTRAIGSLLALLALCLGYLIYGPQVLASPNPLATAVAAALSPILILAAIALLLGFLLAVVVLALRSGRSIRFGRGGVSIGGRRR